MNQFSDAADIYDRYDSQTNPVITEENLDKQPKSDKSQKSEQPMKVEQPQMSIVQVKSKAKDIHLGDNQFEDPSTIQDLHALANKMQVENWRAIGKAKLQKMDNTKLKVIKSVDDADQYDVFDSEEFKADQDMEKQQWSQKASQDP